MTLIAVPIFVDDRSELAGALARAEDAVTRGARLIEWRIDALAESPDAASIAGELVRASPAPCIVTIRSEDEGGRFTGTAADRAALLSALAGADEPPRYLDVELAVYTGTAMHAAGLILSSHDFDGRPPDLLKKIAAMTDDSACDVIKVAWMARSLRDNLEAFDLLAGRHKPMIALCMGRFGLPSRVLAPKFGGLITFASCPPAAIGEDGSYMADGPGGMPDTDPEEYRSAPGQPTIEQLRGRFRFDSIGPETKVYGVIGWPAEHSRGPDVHNAGFERVGHDGVYLPLPVPPEYEHFKATIGAWIDHPHLDFTGASVTIPHKEHLLRFTRERGGTVEASAERIGAANTLVVSPDRSITCTNFDAPAAVAALARGMRIGADQLRGRRVAVIGTGGVARAVVAGLSDAGAAIVVFGRNPEKAALLALEFDAEPALIETLGAERYEVYVNCTPLGMAGGPDPEASPLPADAPLDDSVTVFDTVYTPVRTPLVRDAEARGARVVTGLDMFVLQAALQFERWTGEPAPMDAFVSALAR